MKISLAKSLAAALGLFAARKLAFRHSFLLFALVEIVLIFTIRDSLLINIIMLVHPVEAIKAWQSNS